jgi:hypothetical protein
MAGWRAGERSWSKRALRPENEAETTKATSALHHTAMTASALRSSSPRRERGGWVHVASGQHSVSTARSLSCVHRPFFSASAPRQAMSRLGKGGWTFVRPIILDLTHLSTSPAVKLACCLCQPSITKRNDDPAWLGTHWTASHECPVPLEGHPRCRHQRQRLHLPLCVVSDYTHKYSNRQIHVSSSRRQVCALSGGFGPALILLGGTAFPSTKNP